MNNSKVGCEITINSIKSSTGTHTIPRYIGISEQKNIQKLPWTREKKIQLGTCAYEKYKKLMIMKK